MLSDKKKKRKCRDGMFLFKKTTLNLKCFFLTFQCGMESCVFPNL